MVQPKVFAKMKYRLRAEWGNKPRDHPKVIQEHDKGAGTGDYICGQCGRDIVRDERGRPIPN